jgi:hypothetical protein
MEFTIIILDIPQGAVTIASAIIVVFAGSLVTLAAFVFRMLFSIRERLKGLETTLEPFDAQQLATTNARMEILWEQYRFESMPRLRRRVRPPENPMLQERWDELITKLEKNQLPDEEAEELLAAFLKRREQASEEDDMETIMLLGHGIVLTKWQLKEKELREQK